jgi:hypothetical protein
MPIFRPAFATEPPTPKTLTCPHCWVVFHAVWAEHPLGFKEGGDWFVEWTTCPACDRFVVLLSRFGRSRAALLYRTMAYPRGLAREPVPSDVPKEIAEDYNEACSVLNDSAKASAALSRRCLQRLLREKAGTTKRDLAEQIQEVLDAKVLPSYLADDLDAVRNIGVFAAHPIKSTNTGEIVDVEPNEATWGLTILEGLFDFYFVQPAAQHRRRDTLNAKLADANKPPMKTPPE